MTQYIESDKGRIHLVDDIDKDLNNHRWFEANGGYLSRSINDKTEYLHIEILKRMGMHIEGLDVDHKNLDPTDHRRDNLRPASRAQNLQNTRKYIRRRPASSRFKGVCWDKARNKWSGYICVNGIVFRKRFDSEIKAAKWYNEQAKYYFGEFALLNEIPEQE